MKRLAVMMACLVSLGAGLSVQAKDAPKADDTAQNKGATEKDAVTADKQKNGKDDVKSLAAIRKTIIDDKDLSSNAKNVKILFSNGCATLRGPVESDAEKARVEELTKSCSCVTSVKNLLTVAPKK
jgi:hyperosmotically inducible protein